LRRLATTACLEFGREGKNREGESFQKTPQRRWRARGAVRLGHTLNRKEMMGGS